MPDSFSRARVRRTSHKNGSLARPGPNSAFQPLSLEERENLRAIEQAVATTNLDYFDQWGGFAKAMDYRQMLLDRPEAPTPKNRIRIDQGQAWRAPRLPAEDEA